MSIVQITDTIFYTDDADPPGIRSFNLGTKLGTRVLTYSFETLAIQEQISALTQDGYNRTLRPRSIVFLEEASDRSSLYWADAGAGAILGVRLDGTDSASNAYGMCHDKAAGDVCYWQL